MAEKKLTQKAKALLYDNWIKYTNNRSWSDVLKKPLEVKAIMDKLKSEKKALNQKNQGLEQACDMLRSHIKRMKEEKDKLKVELGQRIKNFEELAGVAKQLKKQVGLDYNDLKRLGIEKSKLKVDNDTLRKYNKTTTEGLQEEILKNAILKKKLAPKKKHVVKKKTTKKK